MNKTAAQTSMSIFGQTEIPQQDQKTPLPSVSNDRNEKRTPDYYYCNGCGKTSDTVPAGCKCTRCKGVMEPQFL